MIYFTEIPKGSYIKLGAFPVRLEEDLVVSTEHPVNLVKTDMIFTIEPKGHSK
jgi:hypothetical protein